MKCKICPRQCNVDRSVNAGFCLQGDQIIISKVMMHYYEEPIISGSYDGCIIDEELLDKDNNIIKLPAKRGSGAIFFAGCNLRCVFCQNYPISRGKVGRSVTVLGLVQIFKRLEQAGAYNINLVTPTHFASQIISALKIYKPKIPVVWNTGGYEDEKTIESLRGLVDIFLVDMKYFDDNSALKYSNAKDYHKHNALAMLKMKNIVPKDIIKDGIMLSGMIIRLLVLPSHTSDAIKCLDWISNNLGNDSIVSIMSQYEPRYDAINYPEINRKLKPIEYKRVVNHAIDLKLFNCYTQDLTSADKKYTPKF